MQARGWFAAAVVTPSGRCRRDRPSRTGICHDRQSSYRYMSYNVMSCIANVLGNLPLYSPLTHLQTISALCHSSPHCPWHWLPPCLAFSVRKPGTSDTGHIGHHANPSPLQSPTSPPSSRHAPHPSFSAWIPRHVPLSVLLEARYIRPTRVPLWQDEERRRLPLFD